jgi:hypothetical protein
MQISAPGRLVHATAARDTPCPPAIHCRVCCAAGQEHHRRNGQITRARISPDALRRREEMPMPAM